MQAPLAEIKRIELSVKVAPVRLRHARIRRQDIDDVLLQDTATHELYRRDTKAFLEALRRPRVEIAGDIASHIEPMCDRREPGKHLAAAHERTNEPEIVEMGTAVIGIVEQVRIARREITVLRGFVDDGFDCKRHGADEDRQARRALHQGCASGGMIEAVTRIMGFRDDGIESRSIERHVHLVGDPDEASVENCKRDGIDHVNAYKPR